MVGRLPSKQIFAGSTPVSRSKGTSLPLSEMGVSLPLVEHHHAPPPINERCAMSQRRHLEFLVNSYKNRNLEGVVK